MRLVPLVLGAASLVAGVCPVLEAAEWYVASGGTGRGTTPEAPLGSIQAGLDVAQPGDVVHVAGGAYNEALRSVRDGRSDAPITVRAVPGASALVTAPAGLLRVSHAHHVFDGLVLDGQYASAIGVALRPGATGTVLRNVEVRRFGRDCVDVGSAAGVVIEDARVHHCLNPADGRSDAHGITGAAAQDLVVRRTEIHTFSGDGFQLDPSRSAPGWDNVLIEDCRFWLAPLPEAANGFPAGAVPGENAVDTKTWKGGRRSRLVIRNVEARGFRGGIGNQAAFNLKESIDVIVDRVTVSDSEIGFRLRGPEATGAWVLISNAVLFGVRYGVRYEDDIQRVRVWHATFGLDVGHSFFAASSGASVLDVRNALFLADELPVQARHASNLAVKAEAFIDAARADYQLRRNAHPIDKGVLLVEVTTDRSGASRPQGKAPDIGAYER